MNATRTHAACLASATRDLIGNAWKPSLAMLIATAAEADAVRSAALNAGAASEGVIDTLEDHAWNTAQAVRQWFDDNGVDARLQAKLGQIL